MRFLSTMAMACLFCWSLVGGEVQRNALGGLIEPAID